MDPARLNLLEALAAACPPPPWVLLGGRYVDWLDRLYVLLSASVGRAEAKATCDFMAAARQSVPELVNDVRRLGGAR